MDVAAGSAGIYMGVLTIHRTIILVRKGAAFCSVVHGDIAIITAYVMYMRVGAVATIGMIRGTFGKMVGVTFAAGGHVLPESLIGVRVGAILTAHVVSALRAIFAVTAVGISSVRASITS